MKLHRKIRAHVLPTLPSGDNAGEIIGHPLNLIEMGQFIESSPLKNAHYSHLQAPNQYPGIH